MVVADVFHQSGDDLKNEGIATHIPKQPKKSSLPDEAVDQKSSLLYELRRSAVSVQEERWERNAVKDSAEGFSTKASTPIAARRGNHLQRRARKDAG